MITLALGWNARKNLNQLLPLCVLLACGLVASGAQTKSPAARETAATSPLATILETKVICREPGKYPGTASAYATNKDGHPVAKKTAVEPDRYLGWPTVAQTRDGELIVAFSGDRDAHVCPWGKTQLIRSRDLGQTWSKPETITSTPLDDRDAGIIQTSKGTLLVSWFTSLAFTAPSFGAAAGRYARHAEKLTPDLREQWLGNWVRRSEDAGKTWGAPIRVVGTAPHGPIQLRDGRLMFVGTGPTTDHPTLNAEVSSDDGRSWSVLAKISDSYPKKNGNLCEPHVVELKDGKLLAMFRNEPKGGQSIMMQSESADGGKSWSPLHSTGIWGYPPHLTQLRNGWVLVVYGYRRAPFGERACLSRDGGKTWDVEHPIELCPATCSDLGYPSSVQLADGSILTVYYQAEKAGVPTRLMSTHWKLNE